MYTHRSYYLREAFISVKAPNCATNIREGDVYFTRSSQLCSYYLRAETIWGRQRNMACLHTAGLMSTLWKPNHSSRKWVLPWPFEIFWQRHKSILQQISTVLCMGNLLHGDYDNELWDQVKVSKYARKMQDKFLPLFNAIWNHGVWWYPISSKWPRKKRWPH